MNSRGAALWILLSHLPDKSPNFIIDYGPDKAFGPRSKAPRRTKAGRMPADCGLRLDNDWGMGPCRPKPEEPKPKPSIRHSESRARISLLEGAQLLAQGSDLNARIVAGAEEHTRKAKTSMQIGIIARIHLMGSHPHTHP